MNLKRKGKSYKIHTNGNNVVYYNFTPNRQESACLPMINVEALLYDYSELPANWDGYEALPIAKQTIENTRKVIFEIYKHYNNTLILETDMYPTPNGTIVFEMRTKKGYANIETGKTKYSCYIKQKLSTTFIHQPTVEDIVKCICETL
jgi:hypothetical protein